MADDAAVTSFLGVKLIALVVLGAVGLVGCSKAEPPVSAVPVVLKGEVDKADPAVVALRMPGDWYCTGTVIAPKYVLTAAHCFDHGSTPTAVSFANAGIYGGVGWKKTSAVYIHPGWVPNMGIYESDMAVVELTDPTDVTPIAVNFDKHAAESLTDIRLVGYGPTATGWGNEGTKRVAHVPVRAIPGFLQTEPGTGHCYGDSGGPSFAIIDGSEKLVAVTSHGLDKVCENVGGRSVRTDEHRAFLARFVDVPGEAPPSDTIAKDGPIVTPPVKEPITEGPPAQLPTFDGANAQMPLVGGDSSSTITCSGNQHLVVANWRVTVTDGPAINASDNCHLTLVNVDLVAATGIVASGNAHVTMANGSIAATTPTTKSDNAHVQLVNTHVGS